MHAVLQEFDQNYAATMTAEAYARSASLACSYAHVYLARNVSHCLASAPASCWHALTYFPFESAIAV